MKSIFPEPILNLPEADIPLKGITAYLSQGSDHQIIFMHFSIPEGVKHNAKIYAGYADMTYFHQKDRYSVKIKK